MPKVVLKLLGSRVGRAWGIPNISINIILIVMVTIHGHQSYKYARDAVLLLNMM